MAKTKLYAFYMVFMGPLQGVSGSCMDVVFELVAHEESGQVCPIVLPREAYYSSLVSI